MQNNGAVQPSHLSSHFRRPLLIYDDKCYSCTKFARTARVLSRGWITTAGHYYSKKAQEAKDMIFPKGYDATKMFWLVNSTGAHGARSGMASVAKEILVGIFKGGEHLEDDTTLSCEYDATAASCYMPTNVLKRIARTLSHGVTFRFQDS